PKLPVRDAELELSRVRELRGSLLDSSADERVGLVEPGDADHDIGRLDLGRFEVRNERLHHPRAFGNVSRHRSGVVEARRERGTAVEPREPEATLENHHYAT